MTKSKRDEVSDKTYQASKAQDLLISLGMAIVCLFIAITVILMIYGAFSGNYTYDFFGITSDGGGAYVPKQANLDLLVFMFGVLCLGVIAGYGIGKYRCISKS